MTKWGPFLLNACVFLFLMWVAISAFVLLNRASHDFRHRAVRAARRRLDAAVANAESGDEKRSAIEQILSSLPRHIIERIAVDSTTPQWQAEMFAAYVLERWGMHRLVDDAVRTGKRHKWVRIAALRILVLGGQSNLIPMRCYECTYRIRRNVVFGGYPNVVPLLESALHDGDDDMLAATVILLGHVRDERAAELLITALQRRAYTPSRVATQLDRFPLPIPHLLRPLLDSADSVVRFWAATLFARYPGNIATNRKLASLVDDPDASVRKAAVETLGKRGGAYSGAAAATLVNDPVWYVRAHAARALGDLRRNDLATVVAPLLSDEEWWVRLAAKDALQAMGPSVGPVVMRHLDSSDKFARNGAAEVLQNLGILDTLVAESIYRQNDPDRLELIRKIMAAGDAQFINAAIERVNRGIGPAVVRLLNRAGVPVESA